MKTDCDRDSSKPYLKAALHSILFYAVQQQVSGLAVRNKACHAISRACRGWSKGCATPLHNPADHFHACHSCVKQPQLLVKTLFRRAGARTATPGHHGELQSDGLSSNPCDCRACRRAWTHSPLSDQLNTFNKRVQGVDLVAGGRNKKTKRTAPKSENPYLALIVKVRTKAYSRTWARQLGHCGYDAACLSSL